jgi:hypothetical protein
MSTFAAYLQDNYFGAYAELTSAVAEAVEQEYGDKALRAFETGQA